MGYLDNAGLAYLWGKIKAKIKQSDWQQNDETAADYVKNRPGGYMSEQSEDVIIPNVSLTFMATTNGYIALYGEQVPNVSVGESYRFVWDGASYPCEVKGMEASGTVHPYVGNPDIVNYGEASSEPFLGVWDVGGTFSILTESVPEDKTHTVGLYKVQPATPVKISQKYLDLDGYAQEADVLTAQYTAEAAQNTAEAIKPDWKESNSSSLKYITNRPFYFDKKKEEAARVPNVATSGWGDVYAQFGNFATPPSIIDDAMYALNDEEAVYSPIKIKRKDMYNLGTAVGNPSLISRAGDTYSNVVKSDGTDLPDTGASWVIAMIPSNSMSSVMLTATMFSTVELTDEQILYKVSDELKQIDEKFIPDTISRTADAVLSTPQTLTEEQQGQARTNINAAQKELVTEFTLLASGWTDASSSDYASYGYKACYRVVQSGVTIASNQEIIPGAPVTAEQLAALQAANIQDGGQEEGAFTLVAYGEVPTIDLPIRIILRGD